MLKDDQDQYSLGTYLDTLEDEKKSLTFLEVISKDLPYFSFSYTLLLYQY
jgi:hypothetical protein